MVFIEKILAGKLQIKMRIISGELKGRSINYLKNSNTRPLKDSVRENIFNILKHPTSNSQNRLGRWLVRHKISAASQIHASYLHPAIRGCRIEPGATSRLEVWAQRAPILLVVDILLLEFPRPSVGSSRKCAASSIPAPPIYRSL